MLRVEDLAVTIGTKRILHQVDLTVPDRSTTAILGPSGSGKSTLLRAIAGLVPVESGDVLWDGMSVVKTPTHLRRFGLMFQGYALFPHLDVAGNVGFGLRHLDLAKQQIANRVSEVLALVGLSRYEKRAVGDLSGGEQQRVALARTLAPEPRLAMLDEPLGALDRNLRQHLVGEISALLADQTSLIVTHDRDEAVAMSDQIALMRAGTIVQVGTIDQLDAEPADPWVSEFLA